MSRSEGIGENSDVILTDSVEDAEDIIRAFEESTTSKFVTAKQKKTFGKELDPKQLNSRVLWEDVANRKAEGYRLRFDGVPFMLVGDKVMHCHHGVDRHVAAKAKYKAKRESDEMFSCKRRRHMVQETKKLGCLAKIRLRELLKFPKYKVSADTKVNRLESAKKLRQDIVSKLKDVAFQRRIYIHLPANSDHCNHVTGAASGAFQRLDKSIVNFIHSQVNAGVKTCQDVKFLVTEFVGSNLFNGRPLPPITNRRYHPTDQDIRNHMYLARIKRKDKLQEDVIDSLVNFCPAVPSGVITFQNASSKSDNPENALVQMSADNHENGANSGSESDLPESCMESRYRIEQPEMEDFESASELNSDEVCVMGSPVTVHVQVEPEATAAMAEDCHRLLKRLHRQTCAIQNPDTLHHVHSILRELVTHLDTKIGEEKKPAPHAEWDGALHVHPSLRMSALERQLKKTNHRVKKVKRSLVPKDGPDFSDSDYEVLCETLSPATDMDMDSGEVKIIVQKSV